VIVVIVCLSSCSIICDNNQASVYFVCAGIAV